MAKFEKGHSGNPGGRPKADTDIQALARDQSKDAIATLVAVMKSKKTSSRARVSAACAILDRAYGKPFQHIEHSGSIELIDELKEARERAGISEVITAH